MTTRTLPSYSFVAASSRKKIFQKNKKSILLLFRLLLVTIAGMFKIEFALCCLWDGCWWLVSFWWMFYVLLLAYSRSFPKLVSVQKTGGTGEDHGFLSFFVFCLEPWVGAVEFGH
jgi:hypothetical protein